MLSTETHRGNPEAIREESYGRVLYNRFRYYDPAIGRYISADSIAQHGLKWLAGVERKIINTPTIGPDGNRYSYALNDPVNLLDPHGDAAITLEGYLALIRDS